MKTAAFTFAVFALLAITVSAAEHPSIDVTSGEKNTSVEFVRCHFEEGRIVVRVNDQLHVLHKGDQLEEIGLEMISVEADSATLTIRGNGPIRSLRIVQALRPEDGAIQLRELSTDPNAIRSGDGAPKATMGQRQADPRERNSEKR